MADGLSAPMEPAPHAIPHFAVELAAPDISWWLAGNTGVRGFTTFDAGQPGPHVACSTGSCAAASCRRGAS